MVVEAQSADIPPCVCDDSLVFRPEMLSEILELPGLVPGAGIANVGLQCIPVELVQEIEILLGRIPKFQIVDRHRRHVKETKRAGQT